MQIQQRGEQEQAAKNRGYLTDTASVLCFSNYMIKTAKDSLLINSEIMVGQVRSEVR